MILADFDFNLPETSIAQEPAMPRDSARLLYIGMDGDGLKDMRIADIPSLCRQGDVWVLNNSKVIPARLFGKRGAVKVEILLHKRMAEKFLPENCWEVFARPMKRLRVSDIIKFADDFAATVIEIKNTGLAIIQFQGDANHMMHGIMRDGVMPLPPYIKRDYTNAVQKKADEARYQTVYAKPEGSVAAPTAGLHFTSELMQAMRDKGVTFAEVTLHVGAGTFQPVKTQDIAQHQMHSEYAEISASTAAVINTARAEGRRIVCVGTTATRVLETVADEQGQLRAWHGDTSIFITPGYRFNCVDAMLTNFHLPQSTLFMLVSALAGLGRMKQAYAHAIAHGYRFYSYGDACFIENRVAVD